MPRTLVHHLTMPEQRDLKDLERRRNAGSRYTEDFRYWLQTGHVSNRLVAKAYTSQRAMSTVQGSAGGYLVSESLEAALIRRLTTSSAVVSVCTPVPTESGEKMGWPTVDDTANLASIVAENDAQGAPTTPSIGRKDSITFLFSTGLLPVSIQLFQDTKLPIEEVLGELLGGRIARAINHFFTVGVGANQPTGLATNPSVGKLGATGTAQSITYADMVATLTSVAAPYRFNPDGTTRARWMFADTSLSSLKQIVGGDGHPIFTEDPTGKSAGAILGYPYTVNDDMPSMASNAYPILFGDFSKVIVRTVSGVTLQLLRETSTISMATQQVAVQAWIRMGLLLTDDNAVKAFQNSAS